MTIPVMGDFAVNMRPFTRCFLPFSQVIGNAKVVLSFSIPAIVCMVGDGAIHIFVIRLTRIFITSPSIHIKDIRCFSACYFHSVNVLA